MKITGWSRLGIVFSIIWIFSVSITALYQYSLSDSHESSLLVEWKSAKPMPWEIDWKDTPPKKGDVFDPDAFLRSKGMSQNEIDSLSAEPSFQWFSIILLALLPPIILWAFFLALSKTILWVHAGFKGSNE
jgi:hypothetical protein